jgi:tetratricopeptide (TPR) repeat protein
LVLFIAAFSLFPATDSETDFEKAKSLFNSGRISEARELLESLTAQNEKISEAWFYLGRIAVLSGERMERGMKYPEKYLGHSPAGNEPSHVWTHYRLGELYEKTDQPGRAREHYKIVLQLDPDYRQAKKALGK